LERLHTTEDKSALNDYADSEDDLDGGRSVIQEIDYQDKNKAS